MSFDPDVSTILNAEQCWDLLRSQELGRLAFRLTDEVHLVPINYAVVDERILFRTAEGDKLLGITMHPEVVFEIDSHDHETAQSVILRGTARRLEEHEEHEVSDLLRSWVSTPKYNVVEITPTEVTGRAFRLVASATT